MTESNRRLSARSGLVLALFLLGVAPAAAGTPPPGFVETLLMGSPAGNSGVDKPTAVAFEPGSGDLWVTEKGTQGSAQGQARVRVRNASTGAQSTALNLDCVDSRGERGILGIAFSPDYLAPGGASRHVYLFYTRNIGSSGPCAISGQPAGSRNRVSRFGESGGSLSGEEVVLDGPYLNAATNHNGGAIRFGTDGMLYIATGDNDTDADPDPLPRDLGDLRGKILRVGPDGAVPSDNPLVGVSGARPEVWAWGLRNPWRISVDPATGALWIADVGEITWEAIYVGEPGADYGYPCVEGSASFRSCNPQPPGGSLTDPVYVYGHSSQTPPVSGRSITGGPVYRHTAFPAEYHGNYFFGDYSLGWIRRARVTAGNDLTDIETFMPDAQQVVDIEVTPDGCLVWAAIFGGVREVCYGGGTNGQPIADAEASPTSGLPPLGVDFTGSISSDPDDDTLTYDWDFGDGNASSIPDPGHTYTANGVYDVVLTVDDGRSAPNSTHSALPLRIVVGNRAPSASIVAPAVGTFYDAGDEISYGGLATDPEEGALSPDRLSWTVVFHHDQHTHPFLGPIAGVEGGSFTIPTSGEDAANVWYRIHLQVSDTGAPLGSQAELADSNYFDVLPNVSTITLEAVPAGIGLELEYDRERSVAPIQGDSVVAFPRVIGAPSPQFIGGRTFEFDRWERSSDLRLRGRQRRRPAEQTIPAPRADTTYTAVYVCTANCIVATAEEPLESGRRPQRDGARTRASDR